jgi:hypothetical protein
VGDADALLPLVGAATVGAAAGAAGVVAYSKLTGSSTNVDAEQNTEDFAYQVGNTISNSRGGTTGPRVEIQNDYVDVPDGQSAYARAAGDTVVTTAAIETLKGNADQAENRAIQELDKQTTRSLTYFIETWNDVLYTLAESGAAVEDYEEGTNVFAENENERLGVMQEGDTWTGVPGTSPATKQGYLLLKRKMPADWFPVDPQTLPNREEPLEMVTYSYDVAAYANVPNTQTRWFNNWNGYGPENDSLTIPQQPLQARHSSLGTVTLLDYQLYNKAINKIETEYQMIRDNLSAVVDETVSGLEQGKLEAPDVLDANDLVTEFSTNNKRAALAREMMAIGAQYPGDSVSQQAKVSHPALETDSIWADLYIRLTDGSSLEVNGPMSVPAADYELAYIGFQSKVGDGEYITETLPGDSELVIEDVRDPKQIEQDSPDPVADNGDVTIGDDNNEEELPKPLAESDPKYDDWGVIVTTADGSTGSGKVGDAYIGDDGKWKLPTSLSAGQSVETVRFIPPNTYDDTNLWTPADGSSGYDVSTAQEIIERRRRFNDAVVEEFSSSGIGGGGGFFGDNFPTIPGLGVAGTIVVAFLGLFGLGQLSGN